MKHILLSTMLWMSLCLLSQQSLYFAIDSDQSNVKFQNTITENKEVNILKYDYLYNGAGIGIGDFNHDNLPDIFFAGNQVDDQLYFNQGELKFKNVSIDAGINKQGWSTGVCVFDVNADGWDDIYVCRSGPSQNAIELKNVLYVNQKDGTFKEQAALYGLDLSGHHTQAAPLDIDLDGDLDLYVMGHPGKFKHKVSFQDAIREIQSGQVESDILLENVGGKYVDITRQANIVEYGYGLGLAITDINGDHYPDIIVCNDFDEPDHLFVNQQNNTFKDENLNYFKHTTNYSMGNDVGDFNNDGLMDYISVDMAFEQHERSKMNMASMNPEKFFARVQLGWGYQYMHNMLHLNTGMGTFQEIAQFAGVAKTDWSWAPLFLDMDMDGFQDLFITNGYKRDTKNNDIGKMLEDAKEKKGELSIQEFLDLIPSVKIENFFFRNTGHLKFEDKRAEWGVDEKLNSNGAAYADLDGDGDLDLILNNVDTLASIYENTGKPEGQVLKIGLNKMPQAQLAGLIFEAHSSNVVQTKEAYFVRGYQSTMEKKIIFYAPANDSFRSLKIKTQDGRTFIKTFDSMPSQMVASISLGLDSTFGIFEEVHERIAPPMAYFKEVTDQFKLDIAYVDNKFNDFEKESLLPHMMSTKGPKIAVGDIDNNGFEDFIVSSAFMNIPIIMLQNANGTFKKMVSPSFYNHQTSEEGDIELFDVNGDKKLDVMMSSGGYQFEEGDTALENRFYIGNGLGMFGLVNNAMPSDKINSGELIPGDFDKDGDLDFIVCGDAHPMKYPYGGKTKLYVNEKGFFRDKTKELAPQMEYTGMVNDGAFTDVDMDGDLDIILVGEWMNITVFENKGGGFIKMPTSLDYPGWWSCIDAVDIDGDGDDDYLLGNAGMNNKFNASKYRPLDIYANDFDGNGTLDIVLAFTKQGHHKPVRGKECSSGQMPFINDKFPTYFEFAHSDLEDIYPKEKLDKALHYTATEFRSGILYNHGKQGFQFEPFPDEAQFSFINDIVTYDINQDGKLDILAVGNRFNAEVETTRYDANCGIMMIQKEDGSFEYIQPTTSGFFAPHNAKSLKLIKLGKQGKLGIVVGNNNQKIQLFMANGFI
ncbi:MAG: VCBS repeat-containing protein [Crocinitomicaceae bacterium]|nr:VCBS repeat-containing protein [Crocinitomicaceae bacterium]